MANGLYGGGDGTRNNPFLIEDADDLWAMRNDPYGHYRMVRTIDVRTCTKLTTTGWTNFAFMGSLDGNGFAITDLWFTGSAIYVGLFSYLRGAVKNLQMIDFILTNTSNSESYYTGALAGILEQADEKMIENCAVIGGQLTGSVVGSFFGDFYSGMIVNSYSTARLKSTWNSSSSGMGGIAGRSTSPASMPPIKFKNCYFDGEFDKINAPGARSNGIHPGYWTGSMSVENCYYNILLSVSSSVAEQRKTTEELRTPETFVGWDIPMANHLQKVWSMKTGQKPELFYNASSTFLIYAGGKYLKPVGQDWAIVSEVMPDEDTFLSNAITESALGGVPGFVWNKLRQYGAIELVNMSDRYRINPTYRRETLVFQKQVADKFILSKTINLMELGDSLNRVYLER